MNYTLDVLLANLRATPLPPSNTVLINYLLEMVVLAISYFLAEPMK